MLEETDDFRIKTDVFEGPMELLLSLIEKRKLLINDIALAKVADDYIGYVEKLNEYPMRQTAHFILLASTLLLIKSKSLLPSLALTQEEQHDIEDLEERLRQYKRIKELSRHVEEMWGKAPLYMSCERAEDTPVFSPGKGITLASLHGAIQGVLSDLPSFVKAPEAVVKQVVSMDEMIGRLSERITKTMRMSFREFSSADKAAKVEVIVGFLALLEMVKRGLLSAEQDAAFADIHMQSERVGTPDYGA